MTELKQQTILIAEDSRFLRKATEMILVKAGYTVITAADGHEALELTHRHIPQAIVLDLMMPNLNGVEVIRSLRKDSRTARIPVVVISGLSQHNEQKLLAVGATAYYEKTKLVPEALVQIISKAANQSGSVIGQNVADPSPEEAERSTLLASSADASEYERQLFEQLIAVNNELLATQRELARSNEDLRKISGTDELTGLANRRKGTEDINKLLSLARRQRQTLCLGFIDVDQFKAVNDRLGHAAGDTVLRRLAELLMRQFRPEDVIARWGGEEFVVALYNCSIHQAKARLEQVRGDWANQRHDLGDGLWVQVTISAGVACFPAAGTDLERVCHAADGALYEAKRNGRNQVVVADSASAEVSALLLEGSVVGGTSASELVTNSSRRLANFRRLGEK